MDSFPKSPSWWGEAFQSLWGCLDIWPLLNQFHVASITHSELSSLTTLKAWRDAEKFHSDVAFLLVLTEEGAVGDRVYSLSTIWVNPYQARVSTMEEAVKQLTALISIGPDWPYALVWLMGIPTTQHSLGRGTWTSWWKEAPAVLPAGGSAK